MAVLLPNSVDPFTKKDWYDVKAPATFQTRNIGQTLVTRTQGKSKSTRESRHVRIDIVTMLLTLHCSYFQ